MKHFKKVVAILLLLFTSFLLWLNSYEPKKSSFKHSDFYIENVKSNEKILHNSKLYNAKYRKYLQAQAQAQAQKEKQQQEQEQEQEEKQERKSKKKGRGRGRKSSKKVKEDDGKIREKTQRARIRKEQENNRLDKYIFKHKTKSKKRP